MYFSKRCISVLTATALIITTVLSSPAIYCQAVEYNSSIRGNYGKNIEYTYFYDDSIGSSSLSNLTLTGTGAMPDLSDNVLNDPNTQIDNQPWLMATLNKSLSEIDSVSSMRNSMHIDNVYVGEGIISLGKYSFANYPNCQIFLNKNITSIPEGCFSQIGSFNLYIYGTLDSVDESAFNDFKGSSVTTNIYVQSSSDAKKVKNAISNTALSRKVTEIPMTDITSLLIAINRARTEEKINTNGKYPIYTTASNVTPYFETANDAFDKLNTYVMEEEWIGDEVPYMLVITEEEANTYLKAINDAAKDLVSLEERNQALYKAEAMPTWRYTEESVKALQAAMETAKKVADNATKDDVAKLTKGVNDAIDNLQPISKEDAQKMFTATLDNAKNLIESDYEKEGWTTLQDIIKAEGTVAGNATAGAILDSRQNIINAVSSLVPVYSDPSPLAEFFSGDTNTLIIEGIADSTLAGAKRAVIEFDCASDVSYNPYSSIDLAYQIGDQSKQSKRFVGTDDKYTTGKKGWKETLEFSSILKEGDSYSLSGGTLSWNDAKGVVYLIQAVNFFSENGTLLKRVVAPPTAGLTKVLTNAEEKLKGLKTVDYTEESVKELTDAIAEAKDVMAQEDTVIVQSTLTRLTERLEAAMEGLTLADATPTQQKLATTLSSAKALNAADYTPESWAVLQQAIQKAEALPANSLNSAILPVLEELEQAIKALVPVVKTEVPTPTSESVITTPNSITTPPAVTIKKVQAKKSKLSIQLKKKIGKKKADSYQITIAKNKKFKKSTSAVVKNNGKAKISISYKKLKIKKKNTYYVKIRTVKKTTTDDEKKVKVYGDYSKYKTFKAR